MRRYYSLYQDVENKTADIYIYGDITSWEWYESDVSSYTLAKELKELDESVEQINVYINSYGGEVAEGLAIYNALKRHKAKVTTYVDGFACSIASVIFSAGDERVVSNTSLIMIHNAWTWSAGDSNDFRKQADDLETITQASINAYMNNVNITEEEIKEMMNDETWFDGNDAVEMGFATKLVEVNEKEVVTQSVRKQLLQKITEKPIKLATAKVSFSKEELEGIIQNKFKELEEKIVIRNMKEPGQKIEEINEENKPLNMMKALFNLREEK